MLETDWDRVLAWRLARQGLPPGTPGGDAVTVADRAVGLHAQVISCAEGAAWVRSGGAVTPAELAAAAASWQLVKTWVMRGTLHLLPAGELGLWTGALSTGTRFRTGAWQRYHGVGATDVDAILAAVPEVLAGRRLSREELAREIAARTGRQHLEEVLLSGWGAVLKPAAHRGLLCFAPGEDRRVQFVLPRDVLPGFAPLPEEEAVPAAVARALGTYGPATVDEVYRWSGLEPPVVRRGLRALGDGAVPVRVGGEDRWLCRSDVAGLDAQEPARGVLLLSGFDPWTIGLLRNTEHALTTPARRGEVSRVAGWIAPVLVADGRIAGTWRSERTGGRTSIAVRPFEPLLPARRGEVEAVSQSWAGMLGDPVAVSWEEPDAASAPPVLPQL